MSAARDMDQLAEKYKIDKIVGQYHSALEHTFLWILEAEDPHLIQQWFIEGGGTKFNAAKILPLVTFDDVVEVSKELGT